MVKITRVGRRSVSGFMLASLLMAGQVSALEPEHETRRLMLATEEAVSSESWGEAGEYLNRLQQLEGEKPANYFYFRGRVMLESDHYNEAQAALEKYVSLAGSEGEHGIANRIHVSLNQGSKTTFTQPDLVLSNVQFRPKYTAKFYYEDSPNTLLNDAAMAGIHSLVLNFDCIVNNLIIS